MTLGRMGELGELLLAGTVSDCDVDSICKVTNLVRGDILVVVVQFIHAFDEEGLEARMNVGFHIDECGEFL